MNKEIETIESLKAKIKYAEQKIKKIEDEKIPETELKNKNPKSIYFKADMAMLRADIANQRALITMYQDKIRQLEKEQVQNQPQ